MATCQSAKAILLNLNKTLIGYALPEVAEMARLAEGRYQLVFLCDTDIPYEDTWDRSGEVKRKGFQGEIRAELERRKVGFKLLSGSLVARVKAMEDELRMFNRFPCNE